MQTQSATLVNIEGVATPVWVGTLAGDSARLYPGAYRRSQAPSCHQSISCLHPRLRTRMPTLTQMNTGRLLQLIVVSHAVAQVQDTVSG